MDLIVRESLPQERLPGRTIQKAVGKDAPSKSGKMTMGFARYSAESGPMEPHRHAEETIYVVDARDASVRYGPAQDQLGEPLPLLVGTTLHFGELEWHVFEYGKGGFVDVIFFYGQVDNIRPEEMEQGGR
ncbi:MAG: cupin domain-containing protein [Chloroflexota bacterium]